MEIYLITVLDEFSLPHQKGKPTKIEVNKSKDTITRPKMFDIDDFFISNKVKTTMPRMPHMKRQKVKRKNTGVQVAISDDPYPIVTHLQALTREELPAAYLESYLPKVWLEDDKLFSELDHVLLEKDEGKPYSRQEIAAALLHIRLAGEHLAAVNKPKARYLQHRHAAAFKDGRFT